MPCPQLGILKCKEQAQPFRQPLSDRGGRVTDHDDRGARSNRIRGTKHMLDKWQPANLVEHLWQAGLHPGPLAGGKDDEVQVGH